MNFLNLLLQTSQTPKNAALQQILLIVVILVIFYFFMIRPQMKRSKEQKKFRDSLHLPTGYVKDSFRQWQTFTTGRSEI